MKIRRPIDIIPNGIALDLFDAESQIDARAHFGLPADVPMILFAGRMERRKGIHLCPEICESLLRRHRVAFVFAGSDPFGFMENDMLPRMNQHALKGSVHFLGKLSLGDVRSCLRHSDIFFMPSLWENCPYSCLEAMAAGRAIVASDAGGLPELIQDEQTGLTARWVTRPRPGSPPRVRLSPRPRPRLKPHTRPVVRHPVPKPSYRLVQEIKPGHHDVAATARGLSEPYPTAVFRSPQMVRYRPQMMLR